MAPILPLDRLPHNPDLPAVPSTAPLSRDTSTIDDGFELGSVADSIHHDHDHDSDSSASKTVPSLSSVIEALAPRQATSSDFKPIPATYGQLDSSPGPGTVAGIVLGSVAGFVLLLVLVYSVANFGYTAGPAAVITSRVDTEAVAADEHRHHRRRKSRRPQATEMFEVRTHERIDLDVPNGAAAARPLTPVILEPARQSRRQSTRRSSRPPVRVVVEDSSSEDDDDDDEVVVIEEHTPPRARRGARDGQRHGSGGGGDDSGRRRSNGYRDVDPGRFAGGDAPIRQVRRSESRRRYS